MNDLSRLFEASDPVEYVEIPVAPHVPDLVLEVVHHGSGILVATWRWRSWWRVVKVADA